MQVSCAGFYCAWWRPFDSETDGASGVAKTAYSGCDCGSNVTLVWFVSGSESGRRGLSLQWTLR